MLLNIVSRRINDIIKKFNLLLLLEKFGFRFKRTPLSWSSPSKLVVTHIDSSFEKSQMSYVGVWIIERLAYNFMSFRLQTFQSQSGEMWASIIMDQNRISPGNTVRQMAELVMHFLQKFSVKQSINAMALWYNVKITIPSNIATIITCDLGSD